MNMKYAVISYIAVVMAVSLFAALPVQIQLSIKSEQFFESCKQGLRIDKSLCDKKPIPSQTLKEEPLIVAWWTISEISRALPRKEVIAQWAPNASKTIYRNAAISILPIALVGAYAIVGINKTKQQVP